MAQFSLLRSREPEPWGLFGDLRREMDALFDRFVGTPASGVRGVFPAANLYETRDAYVLTAELPGVAPEDLHVSLEGATVLLEGQREIAAPEGTSVHRTERRSGHFRRAFQLPVPVDAEKIEARHRNGVLTLRLPKAPEHQARQITVRAGE